MSNCKYLVTINRAGHTFDVGVGKNNLFGRPMKYYCLVDGKIEIGCRGIFDSILYFDDKVTLTTNGTAKNYGGLRLEAEQAEKLQIAFDDFVTAYRSEIERKARAGEDNLTFAVELDYDVLDIVILMYNPEKKSCCHYFDYEPIRLGEFTCNELPKKYIFCNGEFIHPITPKEADAYIAENARRKAEREEAERIKKEEYEAEKTELLSRVEDWKVTSQKVEDEGGKTVEYTHTFKTGGRTLKYIERNVFDFGRVINPKYKVSPDVDGAMLAWKDGRLIWESFTQDNGWVKVRELDSAESICVTIIKKYGSFAKSGIRMEAN